VWNAAGSFLLPFTVYSLPSTVDTDMIPRYYALMHPIRCFYEQLSLYIRDHARGGARHLPLLPTVRLADSGEEINDSQ
jgi:hypothetical protein